MVNLVSEERRTQRLGSKLGQRVVGTIPGPRLGMLPYRLDTEQTWQVQN